MNNSELVNKVNNYINDEFVLDATERVSLTGYVLYNPTTEAYVTAKNSLGKVDLYVGKCGWCS